MERKLSGITGKLQSVSATLSVLILWQFFISFGLVEGLMLPFPVQVVSASMKEFPSLVESAGITLVGAGLGLTLGIATGFGAAMLMDRFDKAYKAFYPIVVLTQTVPAVIMAPLLVPWFSYEMTPRVMLIVITTFLPITVGMLNGFRATDPDAVNLLKAVKADRFQIFRHIKLPGAMGQFFSSLRIFAFYAVVGAVISEWLGGFGGLDIYMIRVKKASSFDKVFAVIFLISAISLILMWAAELLQKKYMPWENSRRHK